MDLQMHIDVHCHMLFGTDDGAKDAETMFAMLDMAVRDGTGAICFTPHYHPGYYGENSEAADRAFAAALEYAAERHPQLQLCRGNELHYDPACADWLRAGRARTLNGSRYVLVDFRESESVFTIDRAMTEILSLGYTPVLAHTECYRALQGRLREVETMLMRGVVIQLDAQSVLGEYGVGAKRMSRALLRRGMADLICSDGHNLTTRPPLLSACRRLTEQKYGKDYADQLFHRNPGLMLADHAIR